LAKGAYAAPERVTHRHGPATDDAYRRLARSLRAAGARVTLATHDAALRDGPLAALRPLGRGDVGGVAARRLRPHAGWAARRRLPEARPAARLSDQWWEHKIC